MRGIITLSVALAGCAAETAATFDCSKPMFGQYVVHSVERAGGTCGPQTDQVVTINDQTSAVPSECKMTTYGNQSGCKFGATVTCPTYGFDRLCDRTSTGARCVLTYRQDGCLSTYDVTYSR